MQVVQAAHATMEVGFTADKPSTPVHFIVLGIENQEELLDYAQKLGVAGINFHLFFEPDYDYHNTALCTFPSSERIKLFKKLRLL